jgi:hypothetical protein
MYNDPTRVSRIVLCHFFTSELANIWPFSFVVIHLDDGSSSLEGKIGSLSGS